MRNSKLKSKCKIFLLCSQESQKKNKLKLEKLKAKIDLVNQVVDETKHILIDKIKDNRVYKEVMTKLIVQGLIKLLEGEVNIVCRKQDVSLINEILSEAKEKFTTMMKEQTLKFKNLDPKITIDEKYFLPDYIMGGVMMTAMKSRIRVDNTIDKRLDLLRQQAIPEIRRLLFKE